ncbi:DUF485 domain-containing protein [Umezawaea tangerina]|uniref:Uncharacterized membrane protein (DUF485 family) n=1 Tax=Umezawaea tangerina TaxID=84725 RepID=A0A2T0S8S4_9PSEU|nr:DUF485 domain-containing protein [Umezawaea tangerina]PRY29713.1 uncharacterized membrane protein (DUF485 family) [Umezawaea tangerina]
MTKAVPHPLETRQTPNSTPNRGRGFATFDEPGKTLLVDDEGYPDFVAIQQTEEFAALRRSALVFIFPATALFLTWYLTYVVASAYAHDLMSMKVVGVVNVGIVVGLLQFVSTIVLTLSYARYARRRLDPQASAVRGLAESVED